MIDLYDERQKRAFVGIEGLLRCFFLDRISKKNTELFLPARLDPFAIFYRYELPFVMWMLQCVELYDHIEFILQKTLPHFCRLMI